MKKIHLLWIIPLIILSLATVFFFTQQSIFGGFRGGNWREAGWDGENIYIEFVADRDNDATKLPLFEEWMQENNVIPDEATCNVTITSIQKGSLREAIWIKYDHRAEWDSFIAQYENVILEGTLKRNPDATFKAYVKEKALYNPYLCELDERFPTEQFPSGNVYSGVMLINGKEPPIEEPDPEEDDDTDDDTDEEEEPPDIPDDTEEPPDDTTPDTTDDGTVEEPPEPTDRDPLVVVREDKKSYFWLYLIGGIIILGVIITIVTILIKKKR